MDVTLNNVLEGTRQYFMGVPKQAQAEGSGQTVWPAGVPPPEEGTPALSGAPAPSSRPPSAAAAPPTQSSTPVPVPPRPPSEPIEPEPHIIHKATVMREAAEKRRELPEIEDEEEPINTHSPPSHIIHKPPPMQPSPAPAPAAPCPSPARPPSVAPVQPPPVSEQQPEQSMQYRQPLHHSQTPPIRPPEQFAPSRPPDPYSSSRPPESYRRYHYETVLSDSGRSSHGSVASPQPSLPPRHSPQTYARLSNSMPQHTATRLREATTHSPPMQRSYAMPVPQPTPPHNDRVPPIHHPQTPPTQKLSLPDTRQTQIYPALPQRRDTSPYVRAPSQYERHSTITSRKYDPQQAYPGYRPSSTALQSMQNHRVDTHHQIQYKIPASDVSTHYPGRPREQSPASTALHTHDSSRRPPSTDYPNMSRPLDTRAAYSYTMPLPSTSRYGSNVAITAPQSSIVPTRPAYRASTIPKANYDYTTTSSVQTSPARSSTKSGYPSQQARMTVSVTSIMNQLYNTKQKRDAAIIGQNNQLNQSKQKRESPLDLSVKTVKNSADSSTAQDDFIDSVENKNIPIPLQPRPPSITGRHVNLQPAASIASHKVDFAPKFNQYGDRNTNTSYATRSQPSVQPQVRYNGSYENRRLTAEPYHVESPQEAYTERSKYGVSTSRTEYVPKIDLTRSVGDQRYLENRIRDDRQCIIEDRKRSVGPIVSNIPEKIVRYETWTADSRIDHLSQSAREQYELMRQPVYSYSSHKQFEAYQNEQKRSVHPVAYREQHAPAVHRYSNNQYVTDLPPRDTSDYQNRHHERNPPVVNRHHVIQKIPSHREINPNHLDPSSVPANKRVLSILRNSLETKQTGISESSKSTNQVPDLIVIDDVDDSVIEITDLTKDNDAEVKRKSETKHSDIPFANNLTHHIQMPKAVDSLPRDSEYHKFDSLDPKSKSPENDVASRIRTKAELKVMPPSTPPQDCNTLKVESKDQNSAPDNKIKLLPKSQKQHLFNQIREDNLRLESVIKTEEPAKIVPTIPEVKSEPMNIDEIERDAEISIKTENILDCLEPDVPSTDNQLFEDLDWANACNSFMEQLKSGNHKKKPLKKRIEIVDGNSENKSDIPIKTDSAETVTENILNSNDTETISNIKQEPLDEDERKLKEDDKQQVVEPPFVQEEKVNAQKTEDTVTKNSNTKLIQKNVKPNKVDTKNDKNRGNKKENESEKSTKGKVRTRTKSEKNEVTTPATTTKKGTKDKTPVKTVIKEELESTDDDEPLIKSKILKEKEQTERMNYKLLKDLSEKSAYVKLECCDVDVNKNSRKSLDSAPTKEKDDKLSKSKSLKQTPKPKVKSLSVDNKNDKNDVDMNLDSDDEKLSVASRLRVRKIVKNEDCKATNSQKTPVKLSPTRKPDNSGGASNSSTPIRKPDFGDGSAFHPGWEEELYKYKRSLRMPTRLIAIPRGRSDGPLVRRSGALFSRGSTSLPDLDPAPLSPAPSSAPSAATDDLYARRPDKLTLDSDLDSNSSCSAPNRLHYDSEASTSTVFSTSKTKKKGSSIVDVLIQKCGRKEDSKKKHKEKDDKTPKVIQKCNNATELLPTPSLGVMKTSTKGGLITKKEKLLEDVSYLGAFRKETVAAHRNVFINNTDGLIGATEEFTPVVLKSRTRTESRVLKQRATIKEVFGDERPASAPPASCTDDDCNETKDDETEQVIKKESETKPKLKPKKIVKDKNKRRSSSIRDGLRSTKSLKRNDAKGRLLRLKKRNSLMKTLKSKRVKEVTNNKHKPENATTTETKEKVKEEGSSLNTTEGNTKRRLKRLFGRRKFSSGFDYIRKKKKIIRREASNNKVRRPAVKPSPESIHDIQKEIKGWFINKSVGETHLHRAARLGYTDCVAYCLEKMESDPSAKDNAGFTPLHVAAAKGHVRIARLLLQYGANVSAAAQGGIRPLHEACENCHVETIRLLLAYGADPLLGTYTGQTPEELTEGPATRFLRLHIADVQGQAIEPWKFPPPTEIIDREEQGCDPLSSPPPASPPPPPDSMLEIQCTEAPLPPFYSLRTAPGQPADGLWCILQDITNFLQIKSKESLLKQIHCGSGSPRELLREIRTQEFLERAQCHQLLCAGEKVNVRASKVSLVRVTDKLRQLLKIETILIS